MGEQSRDSVARLNVMSDLSRIRCRSICHNAVARLAPKSRRNFIWPIFFTFSFLLHTYICTYVFIILLEIQSRKRQRICRIVMTLGKDLPSLFRLDFQTSYISPKLFMRFATARYKFARYLPICFLLSRFSSSRKRKNE